MVIHYIEGDLFIQNDLANTLELIKKNGVDGFYSGKTAELIVNQINQQGGYITLRGFEKLQTNRTIRNIQQIIKVTKLLQWVLQAAAEFLFFKC